MEKIGIIGLGLMGGSIAKALNRHEIIAFDVNEESLKQALNDGVITDYSLELDAKFSNLDAIFICSPVNTICEYVNKLSKVIKNTCIVTDIGSVKKSIVTKVETEFPEIRFIGGHPMAGTEKIGYTFSRETLLKNAYYIITKTQKTRKEDIEILYKMLKELEVKPIEIDLEEHDFVVANISHMPHIIAAGLVNLVRIAENNTNLNMSSLVAGGFKDTTRIASSSPYMWQSICEQNREEILKGLKEFKTIIDNFERSLIDSNKEELLEYFGIAKQYRDNIINGGTN